VTRRLLVRIAHKFSIDGAGAALRDFVAARIDEGADRANRQDTPPTPRPATARMRDVGLGVRSACAGTRAVTCSRAPRITESAVRKHCVWRGACRLRDGLEQAQHAFGHERRSLFVVVGQTVIDEQVSVARVQEQMRVLDCVREPAGHIEIAVFDD
jgi:hypothetical protein